MRAGLVQGRDCNPFLNKYLFKMPRLVGGEHHSEDRSYEVRKSHDNPAIIELYTKFFTEGPNSHLAHKLLHTGYTPRGRYIV